MTDLKMPKLKFNLQEFRTPGTVRTHTSKHSAVRCYLFIGSRATGLYNQHVAGISHTNMWPGGIFGLARHSVGEDVVVNAGTTWLPLDLWSLDQRFKQRQITMANKI